MIELFIDNRAVDLAGGSSVELSLSLDEITAPGEVRETKFPLTLPMTPRNRTVLGFPEQALSLKRFNREAHAGKIVCRGAVLVEGDLELAACRADAAGSGHYEIALRVPPPAWIESAARKKLSETPIDYTRVLNEGTIRQSWSEEAPVRFLPVKWDAELAYGQAQMTLGSLYYENYFPFVQIRALLDAIAGAAGYRIESQFLDEPFFRSLYMSGKYGGTPANGDVLRMDFAARRTAADKSATAAADGKVFTTTLTTNSVGLLVDTLDTAAAAGNACYGQSFQLIDGRPAFVPEQDVIAGFEFQLKMKAVQQLHSVAEIRSVSRIGWNDETLYEASLPNPLTDRKSSGGEKGIHRAVCFDGLAKTRRITLYYTRGTTASLTFYQAQFSFSINESYSRVVCEESVNGKWVSENNWAFYLEADYTALAVGTPREMELTLNSPPLLRAANEPLFFDSIFFEVVPNSAFTLCQGATVRPAFYSMPQAGGAVAFASLFDHRATQLELVEAVTHLFGLHFYTDDAAKTIRIEPRLTFLNDTHEIDWTHKIDPGQPVVWEEPGGDRYRTETLMYRSGDVPTERADAGTGKTFGAWSVHSTHRFARRGEKVIKNPLFTATRDERRSLASAPEASMIVVGDGSKKKTDRDFPEKIVRYLGLLPLPAGQRWGWPAAAQEYPAVMFHPVGADGFTLCFDDEGGQPGLKHYHQPLCELAEKGKELTLHLHLSPSDIEAVRCPNSTCRDFRGNFVFRLRGEKFRARLTGIHGYNPAGGSTRCTFTVEP